MCYEIGRFDPSNTFVKNCKNKGVIKLAKQYTEQKLLKTNALIHIYTYLNQIEQRMKLNKEKSHTKIITL